jgi:hypothetical protein
MTQYTEETPTKQSVDFADIRRYLKNQCPRRLNVNVLGR